ncbi:MAG: TlpA family protein disulfide reductase [Candidatus Tectimicrobiota bacterium]
MTAMKPVRYLWLAVLVGGWLLAGLVEVWSAEPDPFGRLGLERFAEMPSLPDMSLPDLEGKSQTLQAFKGQVVLMNFWTTW